MLKEEKFQLDMYPIYDRIGENVMFDYSIWYDLDDMFANGFTDANFFVVGHGFEDGSKRYLQSYHMSVEAWAQDAIDYLRRANNQSAIEVFGEWLADNADDATNEAFDRLFE